MFVVNIHSTVACSLCRFYYVNKLPLTGSTVLLSVQVRMHVLVMNKAFKIEKRGSKPLILMALHL